MQQNISVQEREPFLRRQKICVEPCLPERPEASETGLEMCEPCKPDPSGHMNISDRYDENYSLARRLASP